MRHVQLAGTQQEQEAPAHPQEPGRLEITPELIAALRQAVTGVAVVEEQPETRQIPGPAAETTPLDPVLQELAGLLPGVSLAEITAVVSAFQANVPRREMCTYLKWGGAKYTTIVKPVLDAYARLRPSA
jgi:hypothetical protein